MADPKPVADKPLVDSTAPKSTEDDSSKTKNSTAEADATKHLHQDFIRLTAGNFETALKEVQKQSAARGKDVISGDGSAALARVKVTGNLDEAALLSQATAARGAFVQGDGAAPLANAQLAKAMQNLSGFLIHEDSAVAMRASTCITEARQAAQAMVETSTHQLSSDRDAFEAQTSFLVSEARSRRETLPKVAFNADPGHRHDQLSGKARSRNAGSEVAQGAEDSEDADDVFVPGLEYNRVKALT